MPRHAYDDDPCEMLARHFLAYETDVPEAAFKELAAQIQEAVEDFLQFDLPALREKK